MASLDNSVRVPILSHQVVPAGAWTLWLLTGGRGLGKTWRLTSWLTPRALAYPGTSWRAVGRTWSEARDILAEGPSGIRAYLETHGLTNQLRGGEWATAYTRTPGDAAIHFANGSVIRLGSAERPDSRRGGNYHGAIADELAFWDREAYSNLRFATRLSLPDGAPARIVAATTPNGQNWLWDDFIDAAPVPGVVFIGGSPLPPERPPSTFDNPHLDAVVVEALRAVYDGTDLGEQELRGSFISFRGAVFRELTPARHLRAAVDGLAWPDGPEGADEVIAGQDLGAENPSALVILARVGERWCAVAEAHAPAATEAEWWDHIRPLLERWRPARIYSDRNFPQTTNTQRRERGLPIVLADKGADSVADGIRELQAHLHRGTLLVDDAACPMLWREMRGYRWQTARDGSPLVPERPVKKDDHALDALRYALYMSGPRRPRRLLVAGG
jgi:hypothetical protein